MRRTTSPSMLKRTISLTLLLCLSGLAFAQKSHVTLYQGEQTTRIPALPYVKPPYIHLSDFLKAMGTRPILTDNTMTVEINRRKLNINFETGTANFNRQTKSFPVRRKDGQRYVRVDVLSEVFSDLLGRRMIYEATSRSIHVPLLRDLQVSIRSRRFKDTYRLILTYSDPISRPELKVNGRNMVLKIKRKNIVVDQTEFSKNEAVSDLQIFQGLPDGSTEILFRTTKATKKWEREPFNPENPRTVVKLKGDFSDPLEDVMAKVGADKKGIRKIMIDPGHGGKDRGAIGPTGLKEKEVTLDLSLKLDEALKDRYETRLTRSRDTLIPLKTRTAMANNFEADLFLSVHVNAINLPGATGSETYYLSLDKPAADHNHYNKDFGEDEDPSGPVIDDDLSLILWDAAQTKHAEDSLRVAKHIQDSLNNLSGVRNRGVKQASLKVLRGANMPAVLVEVAFLTNPQEEKKLKTTTFREDIVKSIVAAIDAYNDDVAMRANDAAEEAN